MEAEQQQFEFQDIKFTDRDVREDTSLYLTVYEYLQNYKGEFPFLVDSRKLWQMGGGLPVGTVRGVLNCMRTDPRVAHTLPKPMALPKVDVDATVTPIKRHRKNRIYGGTNPCLNALTQDIEHGYHTWEDADYSWSCSGWYRINRDYSRIEARIKVPYVMARSGTLIHGVDHDGENIFVWTPEFHGTGWRHEESWLEHYGPDLSVKLLCKYPSRINKAFLLDDKQMFDQITYAGRTLCRHCFPEGVHI